MGFLSFMGMIIMITYTVSMGRHMRFQRAKKVVSDSAGLVDIAIGQALPCWTFENVPKSDSNSVV